MALCRSPPFLMHAEEHIWLQVVLITIDGKHGASPEEAEDAGQEEGSGGGGGGSGARPRRGRGDPHGGGGFGASPADMDEEEAGQAPGTKMMRRRGKPRGHGCMMIKRGKPRDGGVVQTYIFSRGKTKSTY